MSERGSIMRELPSALTDGEALNERLAGRHPVVFLDYDGTLTPIVDRPEHAVISESMREAVRALARRCTVCVVSGRDRPVVQELMGVDDLVVAGSHGFDYDLPEGLDKSWRIVEPSSHLELFNAQPLRFFARFVVDLTQGLHVIGNEGNRYHTHLAHAFGRQLAQRLVQRRLQPAASSHFALVAKPVGVAPLAAHG